MTLREVALILCGLGGFLAGQSRFPSGSIESGANLPPRPIGAGDLLSISVYGAPELSRPVRVSQEGSIRLPMLKNPIEARGATPAELEQRVEAALGEANILVDPSVVITIAEYATRPIRVAGAVRHPLTFETTGPVTLLEALTRAEGLSADAGGEILVTRTVRATGPLTRRIAVKDLIETAEPEANVVLQGGEEVRVPEAGRVFVVGNVNKPGAFPVGDGGRHFGAEGPGAGRRLSPVFGQEGLHLSARRRRQAGDRGLAAQDPGAQSAGCGPEGRRYFLHSR